MPHAPFLPPELPNNGDWAALVAISYEAFRTQLLQAGLQIGGAQLRFDVNAGQDGKEAAFWHLVTRENAAGARSPDPARAVRIPWLAALIQNANDPLVSDFRYLEGHGSIRRYLWLAQDEYVAIMEERKQFLYVATAFNVDANWKRLDLMRRRLKAIP